MDFIFRSPLEEKWSRFFTIHRWKWKYEYTKGSPPRFLLTLPTSHDVEIFVSITHTDVRLSDRYEMLKAHIDLLRNRGHVSDSTPILALSSSPFFNYEYNDANYLWNGSANCIGIIDHFYEDTRNRISGPVMVRKLGTSNYVLYWVDKCTRWEYSSPKHEIKPTGYHSNVVANLPWPWYSKRNNTTTRLYDIGMRKSNAHTSLLIENFLWKPPRGLMVRKMVRDIQELAESDRLSIIC